MRPFKLERFFSEHEFVTRFPLCCSDCETVTVGELLELAGRDPTQLLSQPLMYSDPQGDPALRARVAGRYRAVSPDQVVMGAPQELIALTLRCLIRPSERVVVITPCYQSLWEVAHAAGGDVDAWPLVEGSDRFEIDMDAIDRVLLPGTRALIANFPNNPTGASVNAAHMARLAASCDERGVVLFCDEIYHGLPISPAEDPPPAVDVSPNAISLNGFSKTFGLPGLRMGWVVLRNPELRQRVCEAKDYSTICSSPVTEMLSHAALDAESALRARNRRNLLENHDRLRAFVETYPHLFDWRQAQGGSVTLLRFLGLPSLGPSASNFCDAVRRSAGVLLAPSTLFDFGDQHIRFGLGRNRQDFANGIDALARCVEELERGTPTP